MRSVSARLLAITMMCGCGAVGTMKHDGGGGSGGGTADAGAGGAPAVDAPGAGGGAGGAPADAHDAPAAACNQASPFGAPVAIAGLNSTSREDGASFTADGLNAFISSFRGAAGTVDNIYAASRSSTSQPFGTPTLVTSIMMSSSIFDFAPRISGDGLRLYFASTRPGTTTSHIFLATRTSLITDFGAAAQISGINSTADDRDEYLTSDEKTLVFGSTRTGGAGGFDLYVAERPGTGAFGAPTPITEINTASNETLPVLGDDRLTIYFLSDRTGGKGGSDIWMARRTTPTGTFGAAQNVAELNTGMEELPLALSPDGCTLTFAAGLPASTDLYQATRGN